MRLVVFTNMKIGRIYEYSSGLMAGVCPADPKKVYQYESIRIYDLDKCKILLCKKMVSSILAIDKSTALAETMAII